MNCLICKEKEADKKGSHIIPAQLLKSMVGNRDNEQSFQFQNKGSDYFFGRSVLPKDLEETLGRGITKRDIENNDNPYIFDNVFCKDCEKKLSHLETLYVRNVEPTIDKIEELNSNQKRISYFFWISVLFRCSITNFSVFKLDAIIEKSLRRSLDNILENSIEQIEKKCQEEGINHKLIIYANRTSEDRTRNPIFLSNKYRNPWFAVVNEYLIIFGFNDKASIKELEEELGISLYKKTDSKIITGYYNEVDREKVIKYSFGVKAKQLIEASIAKLKKEYRKNHNKDIDSQLVRDFKSDLIDNDSIPTTEKYSLIRIEQLIKKYSSK